MRNAVSAFAVIAAGFSLSSCAVYAVASTAVDVTTTVVGKAADIAGDIITAPFGHDEADKKKPD
jgi:hypothetical protein